MNFLNTGYIYQKLYELFAGGYFPTRDTLYELALYLFQFLKPFSLLLSLFFLTGIIYCTIRTRAIFLEVEHAHEAHEHASTGGEGHGAPLASSHVEVVSNKRWEKIVEHIGSDNSSDWRLAILECDIILDEMLTKMSYHGETVADKLKVVEKSDFLSIDKAWEAHRVRNAIAHEGSNFQITDREARRVVSLYEEVFKEFHFI